MALVQARGVSRVFEGHLPITMTFPADLYEHLHRHLFPGDGDEHGAVLSVGVATAQGQTRLLARQLFLAQDGRDYVSGSRGYRMLTADFVRDRVLQCRDEGLGYLAIHNHGGTDEVGFSGDDFASHERGYPALVDILRGRPAGGLVFANAAIAGDIWWPGGRAELASARVLGRSIRVLTPQPEAFSTTRTAFDRQTRLLGDRGQAILGGTHVGIIGVGGVGSLLVELLSRLGVGQMTVVDPDRVDETNLPRLVGSSQRDLGIRVPWPGGGMWIRKPEKKVFVAERVARQANPDIRFNPIFGDFLDDAVAHRFAHCDYLFLAADSMRCRLLYNAITQQYLIPGVQVGSKVQVGAGAQLLDVFSVVRPATPGLGCLWCNGLIPPGRLQQEAATENELRAQRYVDDEAVTVPSVITLNAVGAAQAANQFLFAITGLATSSAGVASFLRFDSRGGEVFYDEPRVDDTCSECSVDGHSRLARGDDPDWRLPTRQSVQPT